MDVLFARDDLAAKQPIIMADMSYVFRDLNFFRGRRNDKKGFYTR